MRYAVHSTIHPAAAVQSARARGSSPSFAESALYPLAASGVAARAATRSRGTEVVSR